MLDHTRVTKGNQHKDTLPKVVTYLLRVMACSNKILMGSRQAMAGNMIILVGSNNLSVVDSQILRGSHHEVTVDSGDRMIKGHTMTGIGNALTNHKANSKVLVCNSKDLMPSSKGSTVNSNGVMVSSQGTRANRQDTMVQNKDMMVNSGDLMASSKGTRAKSQDMRASSKGTRVNSQDMRVNSQDMRDNSKGMRVNSQDMRANKGTRVNSKGTRANSKGTKTNRQYIKANTKGTRANSQDMRANSQVTRSNSNGTRDNRKGTRDNCKGTRDNRKGMRDNSNTLLVQNQDLKDNRQLMVKASKACSQITVITNQILASPSKSMVVDVMPLLLHNPPTHISRLSTSVTPKSDKGPLNPQALRLRHHLTPDTMKKDGGINKKAMLQRHIHPAYSLHPEATRKTMRQELVSTAILVHSRVIALRQTRQGKAVMVQQFLPVHMATT